MMLESCVVGVGWQHFLASITSWLFRLRSTRSRGGRPEGRGKREASCSCLHLQVWRLLALASSSCKNSKGWAIPVSSCPVGSGFPNRPQQFSRRTQQMPAQEPRHLPCFLFASQSFLSALFFLRHHQHGRRSPWCVPCVQNASNRLRSGGTYL